MKSLVKNTIKPTIKIKNEILNPDSIKNEYAELTDKAII